MDLPFISIIIPAKDNNPYLEECISHCKKLDYSPYEIMILPDNPLPINCEDVKVVPTGPVGPSEKRDKGIKIAKGKILAFLDDDAFPSPDWLKNAARHFQNVEVAAVGGPAVTPQSDTLRQKASGFVYSSFLGGGNHRYRYFPTSLRQVDDYPTCNLLVRKSILEALGGFGSLFWPGEDTVLCLNITQKLSKKIVYDPEVVVYHHRRPLFLPHLKQIKNYALHRGYFVKHFPETSLRLSYLLPSLLVGALVGGTVISLFNSFLRVFFLGMVLLYLGLVFLSSMRPKYLGLSLLVFPGIILTHLTYGIFFIQGLLARKLKNGNTLLPGEKERYK